MKHILRNLIIIVLIIVFFELIILIMKTVDNNSLIHGNVKGISISRPHWEIIQ